MLNRRALLAYVGAACNVVRTFAAVVSRDIHIVNAVVSPDGFSRSAVLAGGTVEGTLITGTKGDNFKINVINELHDSTMLQSTSIHWHGFFQAGTNWADGPAFVNQCPIARGHSFLYDFHVPDQAGTFWYHSHLSTQYCDGLRGAFIVYDPNDPHKNLYDVDDQTTVITLGDWYHAPARSAIGAPIPDATLINGRGRFDNGPPAPLSIINVRAGRRYRFRLINIACDPNYTFSIDGHSMTIIEADSINHKPLTVDSIQIFAAQRYSFILHANQPVGNYWIRASPDRGNPSFSNGMNSAILRYAGARLADPTTSPSSPTAPLREADLVPLSHPGAPGLPHPGGADVTLNFILTFDTLFAVNGVTFRPPTVPVLLQILSGAQSATSLLPNGSVYVLPSNKVIELSLPGGVPGGGHPFHLHGHSFDVIRSAGSNTYNYVNPPRRDTVNIGTTGDNVTIRWVTDNPGPWFLHCHIDWHLEHGLAAVFAEDVPDWNKTTPAPPAWDELCPIYNALPPSEL